MVYFIILIVIALILVRSLSKGSSRSGKAKNPRPAAAASRMKEPLKPRRFSPPTAPEGNPSPFLSATPRPRYDDLDMPLPQEGERVTRDEDLEQPSPEDADFDAGRGSEWKKFIVGSEILKRKF